MDDDGKEFRRGKPQQKLYKPGSGPLRKSTQSLDIKMERYKTDNDRGRDQENQEDTSIAGFASKQQIFTNSSRSRKPEQQLYIPKSSGGSYGDIDKQGYSTNSADYSSLPYERRMNDKVTGNSNTGSYTRGVSARRDKHSKDNAPNDHNYNRNYRQFSEPRCMSPSNVHQESAGDRNRDSRSMETSAGRQHAFGGGGKPPSGRRNSSGYPSEASNRQKYSINLDNLPPRFRKKILAESGHQSLDSHDFNNKDRYSPHFPPPINYNSGPFCNNASTWSQTLPSRGRGRLRDTEGFDREKFMMAYMRNYQVQSSRRSTPSGSCTNLYDGQHFSNQCIINDQSTVNLDPSKNTSDFGNKNGCKLTYSNENLQHSGLHQGDMTNVNESTNCQEVSKDVEVNSVNDCDTQEGSEDSPTSTNLLDITNLDWTEEVEQNIKLDELNDSSTSSPNLMTKSSLTQEALKPVETHEPKRSGKSRRRDKRSSSRNNRNGGKNVNSMPIQQPQNGKGERNRRDSGQYDSGFGNSRHKERERRDSHRSNVSSNIGNSRDDLDRWRSLRSYSREHSSERRIVSQCNSRDASASRAVSPRHNDGFRVPAPVSQASGWSSVNQKNSGSWPGGRLPSAERGRGSPAPPAGVGGGGGAAGGGGGGGAGGGGEGGSHRSRRRSGRRRTRNAEHVPPAQPLPSHCNPNSTNWREEILESKKHHSDRGHSNKNKNSEKSASNGPSNLPGLLILPQNTASTHDTGRTNSNQAHKTLFDHHNPSKPIIVQTSPGKEDVRMDRGGECGGGGGGAGGAGAGGGGYEAGDALRAERHRALLQQVGRADAVLQAHRLQGPLPLAQHWPDVKDTRKFLQDALQRLLMSDLKFCQADNVEHRFWKILYYLFIESLRESIPQMAAEDKDKVISLINTIIEEGNIYFEGLVQMLEKLYKFSTDSYINDNHLIPPKGLGYVGLALISVQKLYIFLGDLARYKEQVNETNNYAKSKFWYTRAQQINPKNGRPYNQLAILAIYARRKLDAVYYYMRSLMSSNPLQSARESLLSLFHENRKKYEAAERKRRAAREAAAGAAGAASAMEAGGSGSGGTGGGGGAAAGGRGLRREVWVRPTGGRTTTLRHDTRDQYLANMTPVELNKNFITSYLHVHGKLITKIGMETFHESAALMLKQFRALLHQQPLPTPSARLLQLTALNIFAVESTSGPQQKGEGGRGCDGREGREGCDGERPEWLECALGVSLLMFGALLERCCALLPEPPTTQQHTDALLLLPAIKVWSDWMLCHSSVWNPPPPLDNFDLGVESDPWDWLAKFMNTLETIDDKTIVFESELKEGLIPVRLPEDTSLAGFTPLMYMEPTPSFVHAEPALAPHVAEHALRMRKLLFFGTEYLVGVEPPVLRLEYPAGEPPLYASCVLRAAPRRPAHDDPLHELSEDSEGEEGTVAGAAGGGGGGACAAEAAEAAEGADEATRRLLRRKEQLEVHRANIERRRQRMQEMLRGGWVSVEVEVRPRWLLPDTNCFIDHLPLLRRVAAARGQPYLIAVPLVVVTELEGLRRCARVGPAATAALEWLNAGTATGIKYVTSRGSLLTSSAFTAESASPRTTNDDRVLAAALSLQANLTNEGESTGAGGAGAGAGGGGGRCVREVVLLTDDRNLRVKTLAAELPARDLPTFLKWAALPTTTS